MSTASLSRGRTTRCGTVASAFTPLLMSMMIRAFFVLSLRIFTMRAIRDTDVRGTPAAVAWSTK